MISRRPRGSAEARAVTLGAPQLRDRRRFSCAIEPSAWSTCALSAPNARRAPPQLRAVDDHALRTAEHVGRRRLVSFGPLQPRHPQSQLAGGDRFAVDHRHDPVNRLRRDRCCRSCSPGQPRRQPPAARRRQHRPADDQPASQPRGAHTKAAQGPAADRSRFRSITRSRNSATAARAGRWAGGSPECSGAIPNGSEPIRARPRARAGEEGRRRLSWAVRRCSTASAPAAGTVLEAEHGLGRRARSAPADRPPCRGTSSSGARASSTAAPPPAPRGQLAEFVRR